MLAVLFGQWLTKLGFGVNALVLRRAGNDTTSEAAGAVRLLPLRSFEAELSLEGTPGLADSRDGRGAVLVDGGSTAVHATTGNRSSSIAPGAGNTAVDRRSAREEGTAGAADSGGAGVGETSVLVPLALGEARLSVGNSKGGATSKTSARETRRVSPGAGLVPGDSPVGLDDTETNDTTGSTGGTRVG